MISSDTCTKEEYDAEMLRVLNPDMTVHDPIEHPNHYTSHPSGIECIQITEHMSFILGNVIKYTWRADLKNGLEDLKKARWYLDREISKREKLGRE